MAKHNANRRQTRLMAVTQTAQGEAKVWCGWSLISCLDLSCTRNGFHATSLWDAALFRINEHIISLLQDD